MSSFGPMADLIDYTGLSLESRNRHFFKSATVVTS